MESLIDFIRSKTIESRLLGKPGIILVYETSNNEVPDYYNLIEIDNRFSAVYTELNALYTTSLKKHAVVIWSCGSCVLHKSMFSSLTEDTIFPCTHEGNYNENL